MQVMASTLTGLSDILGDIGSVFTSAVGWVGQVINTIMDNELLFIAVVALPIMGVAVGLFTRLYRQ